MNPQAPVHILIIPKQKVTGMAHVGVWQENQAGRFFQSVARVARELGLESDGYRIVINNGPNGGQEVNYLHAHLLGGRQLFWASRLIVRILYGYKDRLFMLYAVQSSLRKKQESIRWMLLHPLSMQ